MVHRGAARGSGRLGWITTGMRAALAFVSEKRAQHTAAARHLALSTSISSLWRHLLFGVLGRVALLQALNWKEHEPLCRATVAAQQAVDDAGAEHRVTPRLCAHAERPTDPRSAHRAA